MMPRRSFFKTTALWLAATTAWRQGLSAQDPAFYPSVKPRKLVFPRDHGAHLDFRTEWWYLTGWLGEGSDVIGFQLTFFRSRTQHPDNNPSRFAPKQLLFAHAAVSLAKENRFLSASRSGRLNGTRFNVSELDTAIQLDDWSLEHLTHSAREMGSESEESEMYQGRFAGEGFALTFSASAQSKPLLRGNAGVSQKGPQSQHSSYYYSRAPLRVTAQVQLGQELQTQQIQQTKNSMSSEKSVQSLQGVAWLDHEWSSQLLMPGAVGWDWMGINLLNGGTLMAFQIRDAHSESLYAHVDARDRSGQPNHAWNGLRFKPGGHWRTKSLIEYPLPMNLELAGVTYRLVPLMLTQEVDARTSTGGFYWEGAVSLMKDEQLLGHGYLELTGYGGALNF